MRSLIVLPVTLYSYMHPEFQPWGICSESINWRSGSTSHCEDQYHGDLSKLMTPPSQRRPRNCDFNGNFSEIFKAVFHSYNGLIVIKLSSYMYISILCISTRVLKTPQNKFVLSFIRKVFPWFIDPHHRHPCRYHLYIINTIWSVESSGEPNGGCIKMIHRRGALSALK